MPGFTLMIEYLLLKLEFFKVGKVVGDRDISDPCCVLCGQTKYVHTFEVSSAGLGSVNNTVEVRIKTITIYFNTEILCDTGREIDINLQ